MIKTNKKMLDFCSAVMPINQFNKIRTYLSENEYNKVRYLVSIQKESIENDKTFKSYKLTNKLKVNMLNEIEDYLIQKIEDNHDRERISRSS